MRNLLNSFVLCSVSLKCSSLPFNFGSSVIRFAAFLFLSSFAFLSLAVVVASAALIFQNKFYIIRKRSLEDTFEKVAESCSSGNGKCSCWMDKFFLLLQQEEDKHWGKVAPPHHAFLPRPGHVKNCVWVESVRRVERLSGENLIKSSEHPKFVAERLHRAAESGASNAESGCGFDYCSSSPSRRRRRCCILDVPWLTNINLIWFAFVIPSQARAHYVIAFNGGALHEHSP